MANTPQNLSPYLQVIESGEIVRCLCYDEQTATVVTSKDDVTEIMLNQVVSLTAEDLNKFYSK